MKSVWFTVILAIALVEGKRTHITIPEDNIPGILKASAECVVQHGVEVTILKKLASGKIEDTELVRKFLYCFAKSSGYGNNDGHLITEKMSNLVGNNKKKAEFENTINECNKLKGSNEYETMYKTASCFFENSPVLFKL